jgi:3-methylcrotonyl-CoA carboxylase beta subunit
VPYPSVFRHDDLTFNKHEDDNRELMRRLDGKLKAVYQGGGEKAMQKHQAKGKLPARKRIARLLDDKDDFLEIGALAADGMYQD